MPILKNSTHPRIGAGIGPIVLALFLALGAATGKTAADVLSFDLPASTATGTFTISTPQQQAGSQVVTYDGYDSIAINPLVGADRFYNVGVWGQGTVVANVEAGLVWNQHEMTRQVQNFYVPTGALGETDMHATCVGSVIAGFDPLQPDPYPYYKLGMAPLTQLHSGAIATGWSVGADSQTVSFDITPATFYNTYNHFFSTTVEHSIPRWFGSEQINAPVDVINSSYGYQDPAGTDPFTMAADGLARAHPLTALVIAAGNSGSDPNTVGGPASGYNTIAVGAVGGYSANNFTTIADFSSRGPQDYYDPVHGTIAGVRAPVSLVAPGTSLYLAYYGGQTGGNRLSLSTSVPDPSGGAADWYAYPMAGTSFAAPIVSGGIALLKSASYIVGMDDASRDTRLIKSVLLNSATPLPGWDNGQRVNAQGVTVTTQSLDWAQGAGMLNLDKAFDQYLMGTCDVPGTISGTVATVAPTGWDFGALVEKAHNDYVIQSQLSAGSTLNVTLAWFRNLGDPVFTDNIDPTKQTLTTTDLGFANLDLEIWNADFTHLYATSMSRYNDTELLRYILPADGMYGFRVNYLDQVFGAPVEENYGLAWNWTAVPEPGTGLLLLTASLFACLRRPMRKRRTP